MDGHEITWDDETRFDDARAYATRVWTSKSLKQVKIRPDDATSWADVEWQDVTSTGPTWHKVYGRWAARRGTDVIQLNRAYLDRGKSLGADVHRRRVAAHELGHALGFCHKSLSHESLMWEFYSDIKAGGINGPTSEDIKNYHRLWG